jgi:hypothetical protein
MNPRKMLIIQVPSDAIIFTSQSDKKNNLGNQPRVAITAKTKFGI